MFFLQYILISPLVSKCQPEENKQYDGNTCAYSFCVFAFFYLSCYFGGKAENNDSSRILSFLAKRNGIATIDMESDSLPFCRHPFHNVILLIREIIRAFLGDTVLYREPCQCCVCNTCQNWDIFIWMQFNWFHGNVMKLLVRVSLFQYDGYGMCEHTRKENNFKSKKQGFQDQKSTDFMLVFTI